MTIGQKFLDRVLTEAKKDVDGFKDNFDITSLPATHPAVSSMPMPMARQVVQLYHLLGVSPETLEMRPKAVREAGISVAEEMRTNRPLRLAAQRLFTVLATAKGFARSEEVMEASASMTPQKDIQLLGNTVVKQMEAVLAALQLPSGVLQRAMRRDQGTLMETAEILRTGAGRSKFAMLASELGVDITTMQQTAKVDEGFKETALKAGLATGASLAMGLPVKHAAGVGVGVALADGAAALAARRKKLAAKKGGLDVRAAKFDEAMQGPSHPGVKKIFDKIKGMPDLTPAKVKTLVTRYKDMAGVDDKRLPEVLAGVIDMLRSADMLKEDTMDGPQLGANRAAQAMETLIGALGLQNVFNSREAMAVRRALPEKMSALRNPTAVYTLIDRLVKELANTK